MYIMVVHKNFAILLIYLDYVLLGATKSSLLRHFVVKLRSSFAISTKGPFDTFLNIQIQREVSSHTVSLYMANYMEKLYQKFNMTPIPVSTLPYKII